jgi:hypothetical protein
MRARSRRSSGAAVRRSGRGLLGGLLLGALGGWIAGLLRVPKNPEGAP